MEWLLIGAIVLGVLWVLAYVLIKPQSDALGSCAHCGRTLIYHARHAPHWCHRVDGPAFTPPKAD